MAKRVTLMFKCMQLDAKNAYITHIGEGTSLCIALVKAVRNICADKRFMTRRILDFQITGSVENV